MRLISEKVYHFATVVGLVTAIATINVNAIETRAESRCSREDVSAPLGELRNQGNIGWCYANVAADLLTFRFQKELNGEKASAGYVAIAFNEWTKFKPNEDAGLVTPAVWFSQFHDICPQSFQDAALRNSPFKTIREQINALTELKVLYDKYKGEKRNLDDIKLLDTYRNSSSVINQLTDPELKEILEKSNVRNFPRKLTDRVCRDHKIKHKIDINMRFQFGFVEGWKHWFPQFLKTGKKQDAKQLGADDLIREIHEQIDIQNMAGISYYTRIFYDPESETYKKSGLHASSIVGRRWNPEEQKCEFKLRNSWGKNCAPYTNPELKDKCDPETGYIWIADTILHKGISDTMYYKKKKKKSQ